MFTKHQRQNLIRDVVRRGRVASQRELVVALHSRGCDVTQATVSRDLRELGVGRARDATGRFRYVLAEPEGRRDPEGACARMLEEFSTAVLAAQNIVLVKSEVGTAPGMGRVIDELDHALILGCVAGDDTVIIVTPDETAALSVADYLTALGG
jgi:transcriptional regulator of arginine metabolism